MLLQLGGIAQADRGLLPGQQVAGADGEDVRAVLVRQEGAVPGGQRLVVLFEGLFPFLDPSEQPLAAGLHDQFADRAAFLERKAVDRLDGHALHVDEALPHAHLGGAAAARDLDAHARERHRRLRAPDEHPARCLFHRSHDCLLLLFARPPDPPGPVAVSVTTNRSRAPRHSAAPIP